jgi:AcrR family transcriptional regulator
MVKAATFLSPRGVRTRTKLVIAARAVFERDGFASAKITDIAKRAKVAVGSFYTYFDSKDAVFRAVIEAIGEELAAPLPREVSSDPLARIEAGNRAYVRTYAKNARILAVMQHRTFEDQAMHDLRQHGRKLFIDRAERAIRRLQAGGNVASDVRPRFAAMALAGMVHAFCYEAYALGAADVVASTAKSEEEVVAGLTTLWARALGLSPRVANRKAS